LCRFRATRTPRSASGTGIGRSSPPKTRKSIGRPPRITTDTNELCWAEDLKSVPIPIARCRELLGEDAESMTDQDVEGIRRHAESMACIVVEMYQEHRRFPE
jgi:hypothetical protein